MRLPKGEGEHICYGFGETRYGRVMLATTDRGVCALRFGGDEQTVGELRAEFPLASLDRDQTRITSLLESVRAHLGHLQDNLVLPLDTRGTDFQREVWAALQEIPIGETRSYGELAVAMGRPSASRAIAGACAANPVAIAVPCHRIVRASGGLSGYRWGVALKRALLEGEARAASGLWAGKAAG